MVLDILIGFTLGPLLIALVIVPELRARRARTVYTDRNGVLHKHSDGMPIRIGLCPSQGRSESLTPPRGRG